MKKTALRTIFTLLVLLLTFSVIFTLVACNNTDNGTTTDDTESEEFESLFTNGNFATTSGDDAPYTPSSWSTYTESDTDSEKKVSGVIDTGAAYESEKSAWDSLANPYGEAKENKLLMIYNKEANIYGYSNTYTPTVFGGYYSLSVSAKVTQVVGTGATIRLSSTNGYSQFTVSATEAFTTYTFYFAASRTSKDTLNIYLTLGYSTDKVSGYAFFDDVKLTKITAAEYAAAQADTTATNVKFLSLLQPNSEFDYYDYSTGSSSEYTKFSPTGWTTKLGDKVDDKTLSTSYVERGIVSTAEDDWADLAEQKAHYFAADANPGLPTQAGGDDTHVLAIRAAESTSTTASDEEKYTPTAVGYAANDKIKIEISTLYELSVWVKSKVELSPVVTNNEKKGAAVILNGSEKYSVSAIKTSNNDNNGWEKVTFYIFGNEFSAKELEIQLWLGTDENSDTLTQGVAYFDKLTFTEIKHFTAAERDALITEYGSEVGSAAYKTYYKIVDLKSVDVNMIQNYDFSSVDGETGLPTGYTFAAVDNVVVNDGDVVTALMPTEDLDATDWTIALKAKYDLDENPSYPYAYNKVLLVNNVIPTAYKLTQTQGIEVKQNLHYRLSVWIKTIGLDKDDKVTVDLVDAEGNSKKSYSVNTSEFADNDTNGYVECVFYLQGKNASALSSAENTTTVHLEFTLGSGTKYDPSSYKKGAYAIASVNMEKITYSEYNNATTSGDYESTTSFAEDETTIGNGKFNQYNLEKTEIDQTTGLVKLLDEYDNNGYYTAVPKNWTNNVDEKYGTSKVNQNVDKNGTKDDVKVNNLIAGIINVNSSADYLAQFGLNGVNLYNDWAESVNDATAAKPIDFGAPNLLMITTRGDASVKLKNTYKENESDEEEKENDRTNEPALKSPSLSFSANSYYIVKCYARAIGNVEKAKGQIYLTTDSTNAEISHFDVTVSDGWVEYNFVVETGLTSVTAYIEIYFGEKGADNGDKEYKGTLLFDSFSYTSIDEDKFNEYKDRDDTESAKFSTATFDTNEEGKDTAVKPASLFSGSGATTSTTSYANTDDQVAGVISKSSYDYSKLGILEETKETDEESGEETTKYVVKEGSQLGSDIIFANAEIGDSLLLINNRKESYYAYKTSSLTIEKGSYYKFSAYVRTAWLKDKDTAAKAVVSVDDNTYTIKLNTSTYADDGKETLGDWTIINFYIKNGKKDESASSSDATLSFILGENADDAKIQGYLFIDNVSLSTITADEFTTETADFYDYEKDENGDDKLVNGEKVATAKNLAFQKSNSVIELKDEETTDEDGDDDDDDNGDKLNTTLLWTYITSIAIAVVLIAVIVAWLLRKYSPKKRGDYTKAAASYDRTNQKKAQDDDKKDENKSGSARDEYKD